MDSLSQLTASITGSVKQKAKVLDYQLIKRINNESSCGQFLLETEFSPKITRALYKRNGNHYVLIDIFEDLKSANNEAREVISQSETYCLIFGGNRVKPKNKN
ncbi:hypothetical protein CEQ20_08560 [Yersinia pseudotuberculosis]|uniref:hypothetical protein n=1 Tax=Yersinia pseudotuberculosis TaxID=633 RepID=UPI0005DC71AC|nr:hypothetical protein [Yersinia pseudotuberculosis]AXY33462.1 hypothetical protein CEQ20_08560 [Yersinia pseudotuberculosis]PEI13038.1 hypothetical protein CRM78_07090 [Yersinia pseudotuberculosis]CNE05679.1 Uncharacterised protein [Yersinia pseudotuberculosis]CNI64367.1 Uncharacterised protein [Yersinia pseudotuberculosis]CNJ06520.1 Uncharacterised protein [Yersinia pseudotuberculosis]